MDEDQRIAYDAISKCLKEDEKLKVESYSTNFISFSKYRNNTGDYKWVTIYSNGKIKLPILRGYKSQTTTELPFTDDDIKWFKRIIWSDDAYNTSHKVSDFRNEFDQLHEKTQQELREIYK